jgi:spatacsin
VIEMAALVKEELEKLKRDSKKRPKALKFMNLFMAQMNAYEVETLLDQFCQFEEELNNTQLLVVRMCKNKALFDAALSFAQFFRQFAVFCARNNLYMAFEMFVISHPKAKEIDIADLNEPMITFIWDLWIRRDPGAATLSGLQVVAESKSADPVELWKALPSDSLAPLAVFVWNKDPARFKPGSPENDALAARLSTDYPLLSSAVRGELPHPQGPKVERPESKWRTPIFSSKCDLELHDLIASHFDYDFSKIFTDYYGRTPGQPPFPHFDHPELISNSPEPPYIHYIKALLPVSAFQQATEDGLSEGQFRKICVSALHHSLGHKAIKLSTLTFIELVNMKCGSDSAIDFKLICAIYDHIGESPDFVDELVRFFERRDHVSARNIQKKLAPTEIHIFLMSTFVGVRCGLPLDYAPIVVFAKRARPAELLLYIDRAEEIGAHYETDEVVAIVKREMPEHPLKDHLLFHFTQKLPHDALPPSASDQPALVVYRAIRRSDVAPHIALLEEALARDEQVYALLATSVQGADELVCALVSLLTLAKPFEFDPRSDTPHSELVKLVLNVSSKLIEGGRADDLIKTVELFSERSLLIYIAEWHRAVERFAFHQADVFIAKLAPSISNKTEPSPSPTSSVSSSPSRRSSRSTAPVDHKSISSASCSCSQTARCPPSWPRASVSRRCSSSSRTSGARSSKPTCSATSTSSSPTSSSSTRSHSGRRRRPV